ncbi:MAG: hypothetical protein KGQ41_04035 [Alphaproteobacteria bacterium]|nr:hypothetical protein [Alphaproteobacteria bacterium]
MPKKDKKPKGFAKHKFECASFGDVEITYNEEFEIKTALVATGKSFGNEPAIMACLWAAYAALKTKEWQESFDIHTITRANGKVLPTPLHAETKPFRQRQFLTVAEGHDPLVEIRQEGLKTMIKVACDSPVATNVLRRAEIQIEQDLPGQVSFHEIPGYYGEMLSERFNGDRKRIAAVQTQSWRDKITVPIYYEWKGREYVFLYERAKDIGVSHSRAGHTRDIAEFEGEVKKVFMYDAYLRGEPVDIKKHPKYAGLDHSNLKEMTFQFLEEHLARFLKFSNGWLQENGYADCKIVPVTHSKSWPEMAAFHEVLAGAEKGMRKAAVRRMQQAPAFDVDADLNRLRLTLAA